jgi:glycosyltransferase involved in cell wall biosynthesis
MKELYSKEQPLVTVGIPVFNGENYIARVFKLIYEQDYTNIEILFADNNSSDNSRSIIGELVLQHKNVRLLSSAINKGALANINSLFTNAKGKYMLIASLDDTWSHDFITNSVNTLEDSPGASLCIPRVNMCLGPKKTIVYSIKLKKNYFSGFQLLRFWRTLTAFPSAGWYGLYRISAVKRVGPIPVSFAGDLIFLQKLSLLSEFIYCETSILTFGMREKWNTRKTDLSFFYGNAEMPMRCPPFLIVLHTQLCEILRMKLHWYLKLGALMQILLDLTLRKILALLILGIKSSPLKRIYKMTLLRNLHLLFIQPSWVTIESLDAYLKKEVYDRYGV